MAFATKSAQPMSDSPIQPRSLTPGLFWLQWLRTRLFEISILLWSLPFGLVILTYFQIYRSPVHVRHVLRAWSAGFIFAARWIVGVRYRIEGREHLPKTPVIFICNHQSYWESIAFTVLIPHLNIISKAEAMDIPVFGWGLRHAPMIPVFRNRRGTNIRRVVREVGKSLKSGRSILLFPEGTRVQPGKTRPFERSVELLYRNFDVQLVPVAHNAGLCWTEGFATKHPGLVTLRFYPPIKPGMDPKEVAGSVELTLNREKEVLAAQALQARGV
jgi:1-acyl-sn-glycerol-3-phosphate acyltransferase